MPKKSKVNISKAVEVTKTKPEIQVKIERPEEGKIQCTMCGRYGLTKGKTSSFYKSNSILHGGVGGSVPVCKSCVEDLYKAYQKALGSSKEAVRRLCLKLDLYWSEQLFESLLENKDYNDAAFKMGEYVKSLNLYRYRGQTYDSTLDEEATKIKTNIQIGSMEKPVGEEIEVTEQQLSTWGVGLDPLFYQQLDRKYAYWTEDVDMEKLDKATDTLIKQICVQEVTLQRDSAAGRPVDKTAKVIDSLIGSLNLKPVQKQQVESIDEATEKTPFGVWIRRIEDERPIPEPDEKLKDVDNLREYVQTWFVGGLCHMMRIPNKFSEKFAAAMEKYTVEKPEYNSDDEDTSLDEIFERAEEEGRKIMEEEDGWDSWSSENSEEADEQGTDRQDN